VSNAIAEALPPKQGFYIHPGRAFWEWRVNHKKRPPILPGMVIPIQSAMQGHPESPWLLEKHGDAILWECGLVAIIHKPCLYSGAIQGKKVILKQQVDNFAIAAPNKQTANILLDMIDDRLMIPMKRQGFIYMYNSIDVLQTQHNIKISCMSYITKKCDKCLMSWMQNFTSTEDRPTPLPADPTLMKKFNAAMGDPGLKIQAKLAKTMGFSYRSGAGELI
jgi:hypothetical protein